MSLKLKEQILAELWGLPEDGMAEVLALVRTDDDQVHHAAELQELRGEAVGPPGADHGPCGPEQLGQVVLPRGGSLRAQQHHRKAAEQGVRHALFAIDNDGGARRRPEHDHSHDPADESIEEADRCRVCWLHQALPSSWLADGRLLCVVVPVQTLETWLLCLRGDDLLPSPEQCYARRVLKKRLFGSPLPPVEVRSDLALGLLGSLDALPRLRARRSFRHFEAQLASWR